MDRSPPPTLLVIEDQENLRANLTLLLELEGYRVLAAVDGSTGIDMALAHRPDLILCDQMMPGKDGHAVLRRLRGEADFAQIPFLFLSAKGDPGDIEEARNLGADGYLTKPVLRDDLVLAVSRCLARRDPTPIRAVPDPLPDDAGTSNLPGGQRDPLAILLTGTEILRRHGGVLSEPERLAQRAAMLEAAATLAAAMREKKTASPPHFALAAEP